MNEGVAIGKLEEINDRIYKERYENASMEYMEALFKKRNELQKIVDSHTLFRCSDSWKLLDKKEGE